jgi:hypothetical protein
MADSNSMIDSRLRLVSTVRAAIRLSHSVKRRDEYIPATQPLRAIHDILNGITFSTSHLRSPPCFAPSSRFSR